MEDDRFSFICEWYDPNAALVRKYIFFFYTKDNSIEMFDIKNRRSFLKRSRCDTISIADLYIGSTVIVLSRQLQFVDFGDEYTQKRLSSKRERTLAMIKPDAVEKAGSIISMISDNGLLIANMKMCRLSRTEAMDFYKEHHGKPFFEPLLNFMTSGPVIAFELVGDQVISGWRELLGPTDSSKARSEAPKSIRARFGTDNTKNACHGSDSPASASRELEFFFSKTGVPRKNTATFNDCTCCLIKPHAVLNGLTGKIINSIEDGGFQVSALQLFHLDKANAEEFYEVYKGVVQEYESMVSELTRGPCIALEIRAKDAPVAFREFVGPADPEIARHLRPKTLRAMYGKDKICNAVHCTDLPEDGLLEVEYFFRILDS